MQTVLLDLARVKVPRNQNAELAMRREAMKNVDFIAKTLRVLPAKVKLVQTLCPSKCRPDWKSHSLWRAKYIVG